jgi:putative pyruvate formate lyase activating enzyme
MEFICNQCPRNCGALRDDCAPGQGKGFCRMGVHPALARAALHFDEEPCISGTRGSGAVFFSGCSLRCAYCQNEQISHKCFGKTVKTEALRPIFMDLIGQGAHNINLVNPTHYAHAILQALDEPLPVPVVWNSSGYEKLETLRALEGKVQVYLPDLKYVDARGAARLSGAGDYLDYAGKAIREMARQVGSVRLDEQGVIRSGLIVRHLILPGRVKESMAVLDWIADHLPDGTWVSLMAQYVPCGPAREMPELNRPITREEYEQVVEHLMALGLENGYVQEMSSADVRYIPGFDLTGVENFVEE